MWVYNNNTISSVNDLPKNCFGFIYIIEHPDGRKYIGKKYIFHKKTKKIGKKAMALQEGRGRKKTKEINYEESDWLSYWGSSQPLLEEIKKLGEDKFKRKIIEFAYTSKHLSYLEASYQFKLGVLESDKWFNTNIQGRYFPSDIYKHD